MPKYKVKAPNGQTIQMVGDSPPNEQEIINAFKSLNISTEINSSQKNIDKEQNLLFETLDQLNRPQYAVANAIYQAYTNDDFKLGKSLWDGLTLKEKRSVGDTLKEAVNPDSKFGKAAVGIAGFAGDVLTDPLTYTGVGLLNRAGKAVKAGSQAEKMIKAGRSLGKAEDTKAVLKFAGKTVPQSEKIIDPLSRGISKAGRLIREDLGPISEAIDKLRTVSTRLRPKGTDPVEWQKFIRARDIALNIEASTTLEATDKIKQIYKAFRDEGLDDDAISKITNQLEVKDTNITSTGGKIAQELQSELQDKYKNVGATGKKLIDDEQISYVPHVLETKTKKIEDAIGLKKREFTTKSPSDIKRTILKYTDDKGDEFVLSTNSGKVYQDGKLVKKFNANEIKALQEDGSKLKQATISEINKAYGETIFSTNLPKLLNVQTARTAKVVGGDTFFKEVDKIAKAKPIKNYVEVKAPELAGKYFDPEIAKHIDKTYKSLTEIDEVKTGLKIFDKAQNIWKSTATFYNPAFHTRNFISNAWQNSLAGVNNPLDYKRALNMQLKKFKNLSPEDQKIYDEYKKQGLYKVGHLSGDIEQSFQSQIMSRMDLLSRFKGKSLADKLGSEAGEFVEGNAKLTHYIAKRKEGLSPYEAGQSVKKYLFDYSDITDVEKGVLKRLMPFYTFTRKNIPLQLESLIKNPASQTKLIKLKNNVEVMAGDDQTSAILPDWLKDAAPVYVGKTKDGKVRYIKLEGFLPVADLNKFSDGAQEMLNMISPILKVPAEQAFNQNFFLGKPLTSQDKFIDGFTGYGEKDLLWGRVPGRIEHLARLFRPLNEIDKFIGRSQKHRGLFEKVANVAIGGKAYDYEISELLRQYDIKSKDKERGIKRQINNLRRQIKQEPSYKAENIKIIKTNLLPALRKAKKESARKRADARKSLRS